MITVRNRVLYSTVINSTVPWQVGDDKLYLRKHNIIILYYTVATAVLFLFRFISLFIAAGAELQVSTDTTGATASRSVRRKAENPSA